MPKRKTNEEFRAEVKALVGDEYIFLEPYKNNKVKTKVRHNKCGYIYAVEPNSFLCGSRCPKCAGLAKKTNKEFQAKVKDLVNDEYTFLEKYINARTKIKVKHNKCGYIYDVVPDSFLRGSRCPKCCGHLKKTDKEFKAEVKALVGDEYTFLNSYKNNRTKMKVRHNKCGYTYSVIPDNFLRGQRCPKCHGNIKKTDKQFKEEIKALVGGEYAFLGSYKNSKTKIRVIHNKCNTTYYVTPDHFLRGNRCPKCFGKFKKSNAKFKAEMRKLVGDEYTLLEPYKNAKTKIKIMHNKCGCIYRARPADFLNGKRCPKCASSRGELVTKKILMSNTIMFKEQFKIKACADIRPLPFDFAVFNSDKSLNCLIEYQGCQHFFNPFSKKTKGFSLESVLRTQKHDAMKLQYCKEHGIKLIRINHPQTDSKSDSMKFIEKLVKRTLDKELKVN